MLGGLSSSCGLPADTLQGIAAAHWLHHSRITEGCLVTCPCALKQLLYFLLAWLWDYWTFLSKSHSSLHALCYALATLKAQESPRPLEVQDSEDSGRTNMNEEGSEIVPRWLGGFQCPHQVECLG